jgi:hypothetical protein
MLTPTSSLRQNGEVEHGQHESKRKRLRKNPVRLIYFDSAGADSEEPFCVVAAIIVHENQWQWLDHFFRHALVPLWSSRSAMTKQAR